MKMLVAILLIFFPLFSQAVSARLITDKGTILIKLDDEGHPRTVENFVKLATGEMRYVDREGKRHNKPFYNGLTFHRVHPNLGIFSGCPWGDGRGWPGYFIPDENVESSVFNRPGLVAMAKIKGATQAGSQFFITTGAHPELNGKYAIFGEVTSGMDVVTAIATAPRGQRDNPIKPIILKSVEIVR